MGFLDGLKKIFSVSVSYDESKLKDAVRVDTTGKRHSDDEIDSALLAEGTHGTQKDPTKKER